MPPVIATISQSNRSAKSAFRTANKSVTHEERAAEVDQERVRALDPLIDVERPSAR